MKKLHLFFTGVAVISALTAIALEIRQDLKPTVKSAKAILSYSSDGQKLKINIRFKFTSETVNAQRNEIDSSRGSDTLAFPEFELALNSSRTVNIGDINLQVNHVKSEPEQIQILLNESEGVYYAGVGVLNKDSTIEFYLCPILDSSSKKTPQSAPKISPTNPQSTR